MTLAPLDNASVAARMLEMADLLTAQGASPDRAAVWRQAALAVQQLASPVLRLLAAAGTAGLEAMPGLGSTMARAVEQLARTGTLPLLERLRGHQADAGVLATVSGVGPALARRIHDELGIESLAELEAAAWDGRLERVTGLGLGRLRGLRQALAYRLHRRASVAAPKGAPRRRQDPGVADLLAVDAAYRERAAAGSLPCIHVNGVAGTPPIDLPVLHVEVGGRRFTALFAEPMPRFDVHAPVVVYRDDPDGDGQWVVVDGKVDGASPARVVRGREAECSTGAP